MKVVIRAEIPASEPHGNVITHAKEPYCWKVGKGNHTSPIRHVAEDLVLHPEETRAVSHHQFRIGLTFEAYYKLFSISL